MSDNKRNEELENSEKVSEVEFGQEFLSDNMNYQENIILHFMDAIDKAVISGVKKDVDFWIQRFNMFKNGDNLCMDDEVGV